LIKLATAYAQKDPQITRIAIGKGKELNLTTIDAKVDVEGYPGDSLIIEAVPYTPPTPTRAAGLKHIVFPMTRFMPNVPDAAERNKKLLQDSIFKATGADSALRYTIETRDNEVKILITRNYKKLHIRVPENLSFVSLFSESPDPHSEFVVKYIKGPLEVVAVQPIHLSHVDGPFKLQSPEKITLTDILWNSRAGRSKFQFPYAVSSSRSDIEITIPADLKASPIIQTQNGNVYSNMDMTPGGLWNGGGVKIFIEADYGNIFIHKQ